MPPPTIPFPPSSTAPLKTWGDAMNEDEIYTLQNLQSFIPTDVMARGADDCGEVSNFANPIGLLPIIILWSAYMPNRHQPMMYLEPYY